MADPAWQFDDKLPGPKRGAESHYTVLGWEQICQLELPSIADDAILFLWRVASMQEEALAVMHMWGFNLKSEMVWVKTKNGVVETTDESELAFGMGHYTRHCHEVCLIGTRGKAASRVMRNRSVRSVFFAERGAHSAKPGEFYQLVEKMTGGEGPYLELFARRQRAGWTCIGDELGSTLGVIDGSQEPTRNGSTDSATAGAASDGALPRGAEAG